MSKQPPPAPTASAKEPCPTIIQIVGRPGTESFPRAIALPDHPLFCSVITPEELNVITFHFASSFEHVVTPGFCWLVGLGFNGP